MEIQKVLFLAANPKGTTPLHLDEEVRAITQKIRSAEYRDTLQLYSVWALRPDDLLQYLNEHHPQIVHFSGHGSQAGEILLADEHGDAKPVSAKALQALFTTLKDNIRLVVLNACYSKIQAQAIAEIIDCVIGMNTAIGDKAAIIFAAAFYRAIGFGRSIKDAFDQGITALLLEDIAGEQTPELLVKDGVDPAHIVLVTKSEPAAVLSHAQQGGSVMDSATIGAIAATAISILTPYLTNAADAAARQLGDEVYKKLKARLSKKPAAQEALTDVEKSPQDADLQTALRAQIKKLLEEDHAFATELQEMFKKSGKAETGATIIKQKAGKNAKQIGQVYGNVTFGKD